MPIAVVGIGFRGPGDAHTTEKLWKMILEGREAWSSVPKEKWNNEAFYHPDPNRNGTTNTQGGHYFTQDLSRFDASFFNMTSAEVDALDPQQRLLLECSYEALENAGTPMDKIMGSNTAVFVGTFSQDYTDVLLRDLETLPLYQATSAGQSRAITSNRLSYFYDLKGPSVTIDTACSGSLVALHLACQSLRTGETEQAFVGGTSVILNHDGTISLSMMRFLSPDGRCYTFDSRANGYARGEGVGVVFIKPLANAIRDGDTIRAVIRNTGVNQDGKTAGITLPSQASQQELMGSVYRNAGLNPLETSYVEAHGTGTPAGDPIETAAISNIFGPGRSTDEPLYIGSVKTNIGHLEGASGVAGLIKTILMMENQCILPNRNFEKPNENIHLEKWKLKVPTSPIPWKSEGSLRASINSFGYGGTNAHVILDDSKSYLMSHNLEGFVRTTSSPFPVELPTRNGDHSRDGDVKIDPWNSVHKNSNGFSEQGVAQAEPRRRLFTLTANDESSGNQYAKNLAEYLEGVQTPVGEDWLDDLAFTLNERRSIFPWKAAVSATSTTELQHVLRSESRFSKVPRFPVVGFVFTGQGAQWYAMGRELIVRHPVFRQTLQRATVYLRSVGAPWSLIDELHKDEASTQVGLALFSQPLCTAIQLALVELLASWGIKPVAVTGHSSGEIAAAYTIGALSLESAMAVSYYRGLVASKMKDMASIKGAMLAVGMSKEDAKPLISGLTLGRAAVACVNSPSSVTVSGDADAIEELKTLLEEKNVFARKLAVDVAYHSHHMERVATEYLALLADLETSKGTDIKFYSSVTGCRAQASELCNTYWVANMLNEVKFSDSMRQLCLESKGSKRQHGKSAAAAINILVEIGPHAALAGPIKSILKSDKQLSKASISYIPALTRNESAEKTMMNLACKMIQVGSSISSRSINRPTGTESHRVLVDLPPYSWNHSTSFWAESRISRQFRNRANPRTDLLGVLSRNSNPMEPRWRNLIRSEEIPWIRDHKIQSNIVYPAAGFIAMAIEAASQRSSEKGIDISSFKLREMTIGQALMISENSEDIETMVSFRPFNESCRNPSDLWDEFCVFSVAEDDRWTEHCRGLISIQQHGHPNEVDGDRQAQEDHKSYSLQIADAKARCKTAVDTQVLYEKLAALGLEYGPTFANLTKAQASPGNSIGYLSVPDTATVMPMNFQFPFVLHPATLDSCFHTLFVALSVEQGGLHDPMVPIFIEELFISRHLSNTPGHELEVYATCAKRDPRSVDASILVVNSGDVEPMIIITNLKCKALAKDKVAEEAHAEKRTCYQIQWRPDIDLFSPQQFTDLCAATDVGSDRHDGLVEQAALYYMEQALRVVLEAQFEHLAEHHKMLYNCMKAYCKAAREQTLDFPSSLWLPPNAPEQAEMLSKARASGDVGNLVSHMGENLSRVLRQEVEPLPLMIEGGRLDRYYMNNVKLQSCYDSTAKYIDLVAHKKPHLNILEIGAGTGGATLATLQALGGYEGKLPRFANYDFTDISTGFFENAKEKFRAWGNLVQFKKLDIESDPLAQGYEGGSYDLVLAANVLHATLSMSKTLNHVRTLLKPGGKLVLVEATREMMSASIIFGTLPGWWKGRFESSLCLKDADLWDAVLRETGFSGLEAALWDFPGDPYHQSSMMVSQTLMKNIAKYPRVNIVTEEPHDASVRRLQALIQDLGTEVVTTTLDKAEPSGGICVVLEKPWQPVLYEPTSERFQCVKKILLNSEGVLWVVDGAAVESSNPTSALISGLMRTLRSEKGDNILVTLDLGTRDPLPHFARADAILKVFKSSFNLRSETSGLLDVEYAEQGGFLLIPRVIEDKAMNEFVASKKKSVVPEDGPIHQEGRDLCMEIGSPGLLDTIHFVDDPMMEGDLADDSVEIEVIAAGINFRDVMMAVGQIQIEPFGGECAGVISRIGKSVEGWDIGDRVVTYRVGCFCTHMRQQAKAVQKLPDDMPFEVAASMPVVYGTAYYSILKAARLRKDETVLIHSASGGLGQAAIHICQMVGAEIFATVGTAEKRDFLMSHFNIAEDHIFSNRDGIFATGLMRMTHGKGVDVIMNSVASDALRLTWNCIAPFGRFIELGKRDFQINSRLEMGRFARNVTFAAVDLVGLIRERPDWTAEVWAEVMALVRQGTLKPPSPITVFGFSEIEQALRTMQTRKHIGKLVAMIRPNEIVKCTPSNKSGHLLREDAAYLLVGGLGGIGRATALWLLAHGARYFIFASRSGTASQSATELVATLEAQGAKVAVIICDIGDAEQFDRLLAQAKKEMPPIRGVIQGAMVLRDSHFENLSLEDYNITMRPKVRGTWNLHNKLPRNMDFFIMLSSVSGVVGTVGQAAYAAAGSFMDAFAHYRNNLGLPATTLDLGMVLDIGYVADNEDVKRGLERQGFEGISGEEVTAMIEFAILNPRREGHPGQTVTGLGTWRSEGSHSSLVHPLFSHFRRMAFRSEQSDDHASGSEGKARDLLRSAVSVDDASAKACNAIIGKMSTLLMIPPEDISPSQPMSAYGMDSLVAVEMRNWLFREMDSTVPILELLANNSLLQLSNKIVKRSKLVDPAILEA
ncbi:putative polyketide synthase [Cadophora sp. DSE1049]|nr:putative polyketide synthase [Cadophora sp. DSE1049]